MQPRVPTVMTDEVVNFLDILKDRDVVMRFHVGVHFFEGEGFPSDREYAFLFFKYEYYTLI